MKPVSLQIEPAVVSLVGRWLGRFVWKCLAPPLVAALSVPVAEPEPEPVLVPMLASEPVLVPRPGPVLVVVPATEPVPALLVPVPLVPLVPYALLPAG